MNNFSKKALYIGQLILFVTMIMGCGDTVEKADKSIKDRQSDVKANNTEINQQYFDKGQQLITQFYQQTKAFNKQLNVFIESPTKQSLQKIQQNWLTLHHNWHQLDFYTYSAKYLSNQLPSLKGLINNIHSNPIAESLIDSEKRNTGIIKNLEYKVSPQGLLAIHNSKKDKSSIIGLHAIEFILWTNSANNFKPEQEMSKAELFRGLTLNDLPNTRRLTYLKSLGILLEEFSKELIYTWQSTEQTIKQLPEDQKKQLLLGISRKIIENINNNLDNNHAIHSKQYQWISHSINSIETSLINHQNKELAQLKTLIQQFDKQRSISATHQLKQALESYLIEPTKTIK